MKLYDSDEKYCHCNLKSSLANDMTISFSIKINDCLSGDYKLIEKECEFLVKLSKKKKIYFYISDANGTYRIQAKSDLIPSCEWVNVVIVRNTECKRTIIYVNGKVSVSECMDEEFVTITKSCGEFCYFHGGECADYEMKSIKIYNNALTFDEIKQEYVWNLCNKKELFEHIFCRYFENHKFEDNIYYYIMTPEGLIFFNDISKEYGSTKNKYPEFAFTSYNVEQNERNLTIDGLKAVKYEDLHKYFDLDMFVTNIISWQYLPTPNNVLPNAPPKAGTNFGFWSSDLGLTPFTPYFEPDLTTGSGNLKNGFVISFVKLLLNQYLCTNNAIYRNSINLLVDYLIDLPFSNNGIPNQYPATLLPDTNPTPIGIHQGNYLNYLKVIDALLENPCIRNIIDDNRIAQLNDNHTEAMTLLLQLQVECGGKLAIWGEYYTQDATSGANISDVDGDIVGNVFLSVPESVEILIYLMNVKCPTSIQKNAIKSGIEWLKLKSLDKILNGNYVQYFDHTNDSMKLALNTYGQLIQQLVLHPHYYNYTSTPSCEPVGTDGTGNYIPVDNTYVGTFNGLAFEEQQNVFGTWAECVYDMYDEWEQIYDTQCNSSTNPTNPKNCNKNCYNKSKKCGKC
jgi:PelA/Pel-15E family pectate lyase